MKSIFSLFDFLFFILILHFSCSEYKSQINETEETQIPIIHNNSTYDVIFTENIVYGYGLSHESINSENQSSMPLLLDSYIPNNLSENRPVLMLIHGGGLFGGSKQQAAIVNIANFFAERGWAVFSIDYRLKNDYGTVPNEWVDFSTNIDDGSIAKYYASYPAIRDAKAALRWIIANKNSYNLNDQYITVGGGSAGAAISIGVSVSNLNDFKSEISLEDDLTLASTNLDQDYEIKTILDFWGHSTLTKAHELVYGLNHFDTSDPPIFITHGTNDTTVPFSEAIELRDIFSQNQVPYIFYELEDAGHGPWNFLYEDNRLEELALSFIISQQELIIN